MKERGVVIPISRCAAGSRRASEPRLALGLSRASRWA